MSAQNTTRVSGDTTASLALPDVTSTKYQMLAELGRGGMATAYLAAMQGPGGFSKLVVIKRLHPAHAEEPEFLRMFLEEARLAARIDHPNVVHTMEVGSDGGDYFIAMEYIEGQSLELVTRRARVSKESKEAFPLPLSLLVLSQVLAGLHFAHELADFDGKPLALVHRDVSPHNVMVTYEGHVKLVDFGIAKAATSIGDTSTGIIKGKAQYMPVEQFEGKDIDRRADVFAVGVMLWQALTGRRLWAGLSDAEIYRRLLAGDIPSPRSVSPDVPADLDGICMRALAQKKEDRYATAYDFQCALEAFVAGNPELRASPRDLGVFIAQLFAESRTKLRTVIEERLSAGRTSGELPVLSSSRIRVPGLDGATPMSGAAVAPAPSASVESPMRAKVFAAAALALIVLGAGAATIALRHARTSTASAAPARAQVTVHAQPPEATIFFDDEPLTGNPATTSFARDLATHRVRAEAPGFVARSELVTLDSARVTVDLALDAEPTAEIPQTSRAAPASSTTVTAATVRAAPRAHRPAPIHASAAAPVATTELAPASTVADSVPTAEPAPPAPKRRQVVIDKTNPFGDAR